MLGWRARKIFQLGIAVHGVVCAVSGWLPTNIRQLGSFPTIVDRVHLGVANPVSIKYSRYHTGLQIRIVAALASKEITSWSSHWTQPPRGDGSRKSPPGPDRSRIPYRRSWTRYCCHERYFSVTPSRTGSASFVLCLFLLVFPTLGPTHGIPCSGTVRRVQHHALVSIIVVGILHTPCPPQYGEAILVKNPQKWRHGPTEARRPTLL